VLAVADALDADAPHLLDDHRELRVVGDTVEHLDLALQQLDLRGALLLGGHAVGLLWVGRMVTHSHFRPPTFVSNRSPLVVPGERSRTRDGS
jgi:hypothetical protein